MNSVRLYGNLAAEEYWLHSQGYLDSATWSIWREGISEFFKAPAAREAWREIRGEYCYFPEFVLLIDSFCDRQAIKSKKGEEE